MKLSTAPDSCSFVAENQGLDKSRADTENKKVFFGSYLVNPIKNAARHIADGIRAAFRNIRSFLIAVCSPPCGCFRKEKSAASGQESPASVERGAGQVQCDASSRPAEIHEQSALAEPVSQGADDLSILSGRVKSVSSDQGIEGFIKRRVFENPYGVVNFIDASGELLNDVGCAIKRLAGDDYARATREKQQSENPSDRLDYGQCFTYDLVLNGGNRPEGSDSKEWHAIHNVLVPPANEPDFETHLKNSFLTLLNEAVDRGLEHILLPVPDCGQAGGTGGQLARALFAAAREFKARHPHSKMPEMILAGTSSPSDKQVCADLESEWAALTQSVTGQAPGSRTRQSDASTPSDISSGAAARPVPLSSGETPAASPSAGTPECASIAGADAMIREGADQALQVDAASSQVDVAGGVITLPDNAKVVISDRGIDDFIMQRGFEKTYGVVNTIDRAGDLQFGVAHDIKKRAGNDYARVTWERQRSMTFSDRLAYGQIATYNFRSDRKSLWVDDQWRTIYDVLVPFGKDPDFEKHLRSSFLMIFEESESRGTDCIIFPMSGFGRAGEEGGQLAQVIFDARREFVSKHPHCQPPEIILASTDSGIDRRACRGFGNKWRELHNQQKVSGQSVTEPDPASRTRTRRVNSF